MSKTCSLFRRRFLLIRNVFLLATAAAVLATSHDAGGSEAAIKQSPLSCRTPFGEFGDQIPIAQCKPLSDFVFKYGTNMTAPQQEFLRQSFIDYEKRIVCCDVEFDEARAFDNVGAEVLRIEASWCGEKVRKRISFGSESTFLAHPWSVLLMYNSGSRFQCGGTLVTRRYVLTAAHCLQPHLYGVRLGEHNITSERDCEEDELGELHCLREAIDVGISKVIKHPEYSASMYDNDIALLRLKELLVLYDSVKTICLPRYQFQEFSTGFGTICGWGATENSTSSLVPREATVPIIEQSRCQAVYRRRSLDNRKLCTHSENGEDTCDGDSGGPLYVGVENFNDALRFRYVQVGVISLGYPKCGAKLYAPAVYTKISAYFDWIADTIEL